MSGVGALLALNVPDTMLVQRRFSRLSHPAGAAKPPVGTTGPHHIIPSQYGVLRWGSVVLGVKSGYAQFRHQG